jgi:hypothetical protein
MKTRKSNKLLTFAQLALQVAQQVMPEHGHKFSPKTYTQPQLLACLLLKEFLKQDYRGIQEVLEVADGLCRALQLPQVPDHSTLWWFSQHKVTPELLQEALEETVRVLERQTPPDEPPADTSTSTDQVALDSTGLFLGQTSRYFAWRKRQTKSERGQRGWLKWSGALWIGPQLLLAQQVRPGPCGDFSDLVPLTDKAFGVRGFSQLLADGGFDSEANHRFCREQLGCDSLIPAHNRRGRAAKTPYRREMQERLGVPGDAHSIADLRARSEYGQRWKAETLMSVLKRKWGESLSARQDLMQRRQGLLRGLVYNLHRLVQLGVLHWLWQRQLYPFRRPTT